MRNTIQGWDFKPEEIALAIQDKIMLNPSLDLTNACNLNCPYCYIEPGDSSKKIRKAHELTFRETIDIIDQFSTLGAKTINIVGAGEPTIDPHFREIIAYISQKGLTTMLFTNGIKLIQDELIDFLYNHNVSVVLKFNSRDPKTQDLLAGSIGYTEKRDFALNKLINRGFNKHPTTRLGVDILALNNLYDEIISIYQWCRELNVFPIVADYIPTGRTEEGIFSGYSALEENCVPNGELLHIVKNLTPMSAPRRSSLIRELITLDKFHKIEREKDIAYFCGTKCTQLLGLYIDIIGNIFPCVAQKTVINGYIQDVNLGNFRDGVSIKNIWLDNQHIENLRSQYTGVCPFKPIIK